MDGSATRRRFLGATIPAALVGSQLRAAESKARPGPNETVVMGLIGSGGRGRGVMRNFMKLPGVKIAGVCDVNQKRLADGLKDAGGKAKTYGDYRKLLEDKSIDAVIVGTNGHWHVLPTIHACQAGKDVYVEKPLGTSIGEGRAAVAAARKHDRIVQIGTQQRSWEHYRQAVEEIRSGVLGDISAVDVWDFENQYPGFPVKPDCAPPPELDWDFWVGPSPKAPYNPNRYENHYWWFDYGGGWEVDWAVHHYDIVHWAMGVFAPIAVMAGGGKMAFANDCRQWPDTLTGVCEYPAGPVAKRGFLMTYQFRGGGCALYHGSRHGKAFHGSNGVLVLNRGGYRIHSETHGNSEKKVIADKIVKSGRENHAEVFLQCVREHKRPEADVEIGHWATNPGHLMNIAWRVGRRIKWDPKAEHVIDDAEADALVTKRYREPWSLPA